MSKLQAALSWAARGFKVFPLHANSKEPVHSQDWFNHSTSDPAAIRAMWVMPVIGGEFDYNVGCDTTGMVVVDVDTKNGKDGHNEYMQLGGSYDTLVVQTPTGGYHCYFEGPDSANVSISQAVDIRSHHGYVVAPGSTIDGVAYTVLTDRDPEWVPLTVDKKLKPPYVRSETMREADDNPAAVQAAINFLVSTPPAIEGQRGDETTFITAARLVREMSLSPSKAFELLCEHWNPRCSPPWDLDELRVKVENAAAYGNAEQGRLDPSLVFANVHVEPPPSISEQVHASWGNAIDASATRPRPWLMDRLLMLEKVSMIAAAGSAGKSTLALSIAIFGALGLDFGTFKTHRPFNSVIFNGEDDIEEMSRRLQAICATYNFDYQEVRKHLYLLSYEEIELKLVTTAGRVPVKNDAVVQYLNELCAHESVGLLVLDPLVDVHDCDEGDSTQMNKVMAVAQGVAKTSCTSVLIMHHSTKSGGERQEGRIGNADIFRGSSSIINKCRAAFTLMDASQDDTEQYDIQDSERHAWVRMDDAKMNLTLKSRDPIWFKKVGTRITSGDIVGVLHKQELTKSTSHLRLRIANILIQTMQANNAGSMPISQAVAVVRGGEPIMANKKEAEVKQTLTTMFGIAIDIRGSTLHIKRDGEGGKGNLIVTLT